MSDESTRAATFYCPYCGEEDLHPSETAEGAWECRACTRAFKVSFLGLVSSPRPRNPRGSAGFPRGDGGIRYSPVGGGGA